MAVEVVFEGGGCLWLWRAVFCSEGGGLLRGRHKGKSELRRVLKGREWPSLRVVVVFGQLPERKIRIQRGPEVIYNCHSIIR